MRITIGELINELSSYSRNIEIKTVGNVPFIKADIGNEYFTKGHIYIVQVSEHKYSICDCQDDLHGNRYIPTQDKDNPFIKEKMIIQNKFQYKSEDIEEEDDENSIVLNIGYLSFLEKFYEILFKYQVIKVDPKIFNDRITMLESLKPYQRLISQMNLIFKSKKIPDAKVRDLIRIVKLPQNSFNIRSMKKGDIKILETQFKKMGIHLIIRKNVIADLYFEKII